jgi:hypothetical protein
VPERFCVVVSLPYKPLASGANVRYEYGGLLKKTIHMTTSVAGVGYLSAGAKPGQGILGRIAIDYTDENGVVYDFEGEAMFGIPRKEFVGRVDPTMPMYPQRRDFILGRSRHQKIQEVHLHGLLQHQLAVEPEGSLLLDDHREMCETLIRGYPSAATALAGKVLEGILRIRGERERWWDDAWDRMTIGALLDEEAVRAAIRKQLGDGWLRKIEGAGALRILGAHHKGVRITMAEANSAANVVNDVLAAWWAKDGAAAPTVLPRR